MFDFARVKPTSIFMSILVLGLQFNLSAADLRIKVADIKNNQGKLMVAVFDKDSAYKALDYRKAYATFSINARQGEQRVTLHDLPHGEYAITLFHDENGNEKVDTGRSDLPKEGYGTSRATSKMQILDFDEAAIRLKNSHTSVSIKLFYW